MVNKCFGFPRKVSKFRRQENFFVIVILVKNFNLLENTIYFTLLRLKSVSIWSFLCVFSRIRMQYGDLEYKYPYSP